MSLKEKLFGKKIADKSDYFNRKIIEINKNNSEILCDIDLTKVVVPSFDSNHMKYTITSELPNCVSDEIESAFQESLLK